MQSPAEQLVPLSFLSNSHTTILIRPPISSTRPFPQPLHVLGLAYAYALEQHSNAYNLLADPSRPSLARRPPIAVYGSGLGGTLATSLALTECRPLNGAGQFIEAFMARDAVYDFSPLAMAYLREHVKSDHKSADEQELSVMDYLSPDSDLTFEYPPSNDYISSSPPQSSSYNSKSAGWDTSTKERLFDSIPTLFGKPEIAHDPFASPLLFFRGAANDTPTGWNWSGPPRRSRFQVDIEAERSRSYLKYPPRELGLRIPWARLCVSGAPKAKPSPKRRGRAKRDGGLDDKGIGLQDASSEAALQYLYAEQAEVMAKAMGRSIEKGYEDPRFLMGLKDIDPADRVQLVYTGIASSDQLQQQSDEDGVAMIQWLDEIVDWK